MTIRESETLGQAQILGFDPDTPEWHERRRSSITGTDVAAILGEHPWKTECEVWARIKGEPLPEREKTQAMEAGLRLEGVVKDWYEDETGMKTNPSPGLIRHPDLPFFVGTPDFVAYEPPFSSETSCGILECKTTSSWKVADWDEGPPAFYNLQVQAYLALTGFKWGAIAVLIGGQAFRWAEVQRQEELLESLPGFLSDWWEKHIVGDEMPEPSRPRDAKVFSSLHPDDDGSTVELSDEAARAAKHYVELGNQIKELSAAKDIAKAHVLRAMGPATFGSRGLINVSNKTQSRSERTIKPSTFRVLRIKEVSDG